MSNYRYDAFSDALDVVAQTERHVIPTASPFVVRLGEVPHKATPSTVVVKTLSMLMAAITSTSATSITIANGAWFSVNDVITIDNEQMLITAIATNVLTVTRGYNSTTAATHTIAAPVYGSAWAEVAATPAARQYWPDYATSADGDENWNTGTIAFNSADAGKLVDVSYDGVGTLAAIDAPLNVPEWTHDYGNGADGHFIATGAETISGVKNYKSVVIPAGMTVTVGSEPLVIKSQGAVIIAGTINGAGGNGAVNAVGAGRGGGANGGLGSGASGGTGTGGGGGGASGSLTAASMLFGRVAANKSATPSAAWQYLAANNALSVLPAGGGGAGGTDDYDRTTGGGGGGACVIVIAPAIVVSGAITVRGGNGVSYSSNGVHSGAGGGGVVMLVGGKVANTGTITVSGGTGGVAGGAGWSKIIEVGG